MRAKLKAYLGTKKPPLSSGEVARSSAVGVRAKRPLEEVHGAKPAEKRKRLLQESRAPSVAKGAPQIFPHVVKAPRVPAKPTSPAATPAAPTTPVQLGMDVLRQRLFLHRAANNPDGFCPVPCAELEYLLRLSPEQVLARRAAGQELTDTLKMVVEDLERRSLVLCDYEEQISSKHNPLLYSHDGFPSIA